MMLKPDSRIKGEMVLMNWLKYRWVDDEKEIRDILGYKSVASVTVHMLFKYQDHKNIIRWHFIPMSADCFLWDWQGEAIEFLERDTEPNKHTDKTLIDKIIKAISGPRGKISQGEAVEWANEINRRRDK